MFNIYDIYGYFETLLKLLLMARYFDRKYEKEMDEMELAGGR